MTIQQVWSGLGTAKLSPYYANIENVGSSDDGVLYTSNDQEAINIDYPIELPSGSKKRVLFLMGGYNEGRVYLRTSHGLVDSPVRSNYVSEQARLGLISDNPSDLTFMKGSDSANTNSAIGVGGCIPEDAPDRFLGYECLDAVVLGDGTERLRDDQISAIKDYVRSGGVVLFIGGAAPSAVSDPRWNDVVPISQGTVVTRNGLSERVGIHNPNSRQISVPRGSAFVKSYGMGLATFLSVSPFDSPIREYEDRRSLVSRVVIRMHHGLVQRMLDAQIDQVDADYYGGSSSATAMAYSSPPMVSSSTGISAKVVPMKNDPFLTRPPSVNSIMWILIGYVILVVPVNFLVLRKLNRLEAAWVTTPIISVAFSAILLNSTINLYQASATTKTLSVATLEDGSGSAMVYGNSEMFFPRAKSYDLGIQGVQSVDTLHHSGPSASSGINLVDNGREILAPAVNTSNLAFKDLQYVQSSQELQGLKVGLTTKDGHLTLSILNRSRVKITSLKVFSPSNSLSYDKAIQAGSRFEVDISSINNKGSQSNKDQNVDSWQMVAASLPNRIVVFATTDGMKVGPKYGAGHPNSQYAMVTAPNLEDLP